MLKPARLFKINSLKSKYAIYNDAVYRWRVSPTESIVVKHPPYDAGLLQLNRWKFLGIFLDKLIAVLERLLSG